MVNKKTSLDDRMAILMVILNTIGLEEPKQRAVLASMNGRATPAQERLARRIQKERMEAFTAGMMVAFGDDFRTRIAELGGPILVYQDELEQIKRAEKYRDN